MEVIHVPEPYSWNQEYSNKKYGCRSSSQKSFAATWNNIFTTNNFEIYDLKGPNPLYDLIFLMSLSCCLYGISMRSYFIYMYLYVIRFSVVCTRTSFACHSYVLLCHPYVTRIWFYHERLNKCFEQYFIYQGKLKKHFMATWIVFNLKNY